MYVRELYNMHFSLSISFPVVRQLLVSRHACRLVASSDVKFIFITLSTSFFLFTFDRPRCRLHHDDQVITRTGHHLSSMHTTCLFHTYVFTRNIKYACRK